MVAFALQFARPLYQTLVLLVIVYVGMFLAQSVGPVQALLGRANPDLEDASRGLGRGWGQTLIRVTVPLVRPGMLAGAALVFVSVMKELPATLLLRPAERVRDPGHPHLERHGRRLLYESECGKPPSRRRVVRATLGIDKS